MFSKRKKNGIWEIIEKNRIVEVFNDEKEADNFLKKLNSGRLVPASVSFNSIVRQGGRYTLHVVIPKNIAKRFSVLPGDVINLSINLSISKKFINVGKENEND